MFYTKQELIEFINQQEVVYDLIGKIGLNDFLVELGKRHSFAVLKEEKTFIHAIEETDLTSS